jgi:thiamine biosynthesis lipoprotein ApbE
MVLGVAAPAASTPPLHLTGIAFDQSLEIEVRDLPANVADDIGRKALERIRALEKLTDPNGSAAAGVALLNVAAGKPAVKLDPELFALLLKAAGFCEWSSGVHGPLGGHLGALWGPRRSDHRDPDPR